jgi:hypothetical protein
VALQNDNPFAASPPLTHEQLRAAVTVRRMRYFTLGYEPIPVISGRKRPALDGWQEVKLNLDTIRTWGDARPGELSTGIRTRFAPSFDIDIRDADMADQIQQVLLNLLPQGTILKRTGQAPKRLIPCRCTTPFDKISVHFKSLDNVLHGIDVLCDGQQFVAEGIHETTQQPYRWDDNIDLLNAAREHLPLVDKALAQRFIAEASAIVERAGWIKVDAQGRPKKANVKAKSKTKIEPKVDTGPNSIYYLSALKDECAALAAMPPNSGRSNALNAAAFNLFQLVAGGGLDEKMVRDRLFAAAEVCGLVAEDGEASVRATIESGAKVGRARPRQAPEHNGKHGGDRAYADDDDENDEVTTADADQQMQGIDWLWPGRFARGKFGLIAGLPDYGKGQIAAFIAAAVTANVDLPCDEGNATQGNVLWFNAEDGLQDTVIPRLAAAGADRKRVHFVNGVRIAGEEKHFSLVTDLHLLRKAIIRIGNVVLVIIDPISAYLGVGKVDGRSATDVRGVLTPLKAMAEELHVAVIGIAPLQQEGRYQVRAAARQRQHRLRRRGAPRLCRARRSRGQGQQALHQSQEQSCARHQGAALRHRREDRRARSKARRRHRRTLHRLAPAIRRDHRQRSHGGSRRPHC